MVRDLIVTLAPYGILSDALMCCLIATIGEVVRMLSWWMTLLVATLMWETAVLGIVLWHLRPC